MATKRLRFNPVVEEYEARQLPDPPTCRSPVPGSPPVLSHKLLPKSCLRLDFSLPSSVFRATPELDLITLSKSAFTPPLTCVTIRIPATPALDESPGLCKFLVLHNPEGEPVTVGDVLTTILDKLREPEVNISPGVLSHFMRRVETVESYGHGLDASARQENKRAEERAGTRRVDRLQGHVLFAGFDSPTSVEPETCLKLEHSPRYDSV
ncbi:hypothetical protein B0H15DRAFT_806360 [Mycena belliarum]|uniref:DUF6699 domain-containing protein n=1 Tax=Mycena belliarum TaxID=1033014 RepID=A0AAD6TQS9_9AGAR|nr:hypothetical protein B0H15DRAFT_806360 [Mycena belliae]